MSNIVFVFFIPVALVLTLTSAGLAFYFGIRSRNERVRSFFKKLTTVKGASVLVVFASIAVGFSWTYVDELSKPDLESLLQCHTCGDRKVQINMSEELRKINLPKH